MRDFIDALIFVFIPTVFIAAGIFGLIFVTIYHVESKVCTAYGEKLNIETDYDYQCFIKDNVAWKLKPVASQEGE